MKLLIMILLSSLTFADPGEKDKVIEAEPGSEIAVSGGSKKPIATTTVAPAAACHMIKYRFYYTNKTRITKKVANKWHKQIAWWINTYNEHCDPQVPLCGPTRLADDVDVVLMGKHKGKNKEFTKFRSNATKRKYVPAYRYLKGIDTFDRRVKQVLSPARNNHKSKTEDADPITFHIGAFKAVIITSRGNDHLTDGKGNINSNIMAAKKAINNRGAQHEAGHLFGVEDNSGGIMSKIPPNRNNLKGRYGNERTGGWSVKSVRDFRCNAIKVHLRVN